MENWKNADAVLEFMWKELEDIPFNETKEKKLLLAEDWLFFPKGTEREEIWLWFDANHSKGVVALMSPQDRKAILVHSDGYSITEESYESVEAAQQAMEEQYKDSYPYGEGEEADEITAMSDCGNAYAILYDRGSDVYLWQIIEL